MNCHEFDLLVIDWVRGAALDAQTAIDAEAHAAACGHCRERLAGERALTASFEQLANSTAARETPAGVEDLLRTVFREQMVATQPHPAIGHLKDRAHLTNEAHLKDGGHLKGAWHLKDWWHLTTRPPLGRAAWTGAAAAVVIAGVLLWVSRERGPAPPETRPVIAETAPLSGEQPRNVQPSNGQPSVVRSPPETPPRANQPPSPPPAARRREPEQLAALRAATGQSQEEATLRDPVGGNAAATVREVTTEFLPFPYAEGLSAGERVQLIHVRLPGEALTFFGLPPAADPSATVPADVLLGQDGTARAVRFVRFTGSTGVGEGSHY